MFDFSTRQQLIFMKLNICSQWLRNEEYKVSHLQQYLVNYGKFSEVP